MSRRRLQSVTLAALLLAASACLTKRGDDPTAPRAPTCSPTLATATARPLDRVAIRGVPDSLARGPVTARVSAGGRDGLALVERLADGTLELLVPLHPSGAIAGGPVTLTLGAGPATCDPVALTIAAIPAAPGTARAVASRMQGIVDALATSLGGSAAALRGDIDALAPEQLALAVAQRFLDHPKSPNSLAAQLAGTAPVLAGAPVDAQVLDALLASSGVLATLQAFGDSLAAFGPPPASALDPATSSSSAPASARVGGASGIRTAAQLQYWMRRQQDVSRLASKEMQKVQAQLSFALTLFSVVPGAQGATTVVGTLMYFNQLLVDGLQKLLPSELVALTFDVDTPILAEDATTPGRWSNARLTASSDTWRITVPTLADGLLTAWGAAGGALSRVIKTNPALEKAFESSVSQFVTGLASTVSTVVGVSFEIEDGAYAAGPFTYGPVDVGGAQWTQVTTTPAGVLTLSAADRTAYHPASPGVADLVLSVVPAAFAGDTVSDRERIQVIGLDVAILPTTRRMRPGEQFDFTAVVTHATDARVTWSASGGSITATGRYTAPTTPGTYTVTAASATRPSRKATATVEVTNDLVVSVTPSAPSVRAGGTVAFSASVSGTTNQAVTWSASGGTITSAGLFTAPASAGTVTITARSAQDPNASGTATVTVTDGVTVRIEPATVTLAPGAQYTFRAIVEGTTNTAVTWVTTPGAGTITTAGVYTAPTTPGTYALGVRSVADPNAIATATVTVAEPPRATRYAVTVLDGMAEAYAINESGDVAGVGLVGSASGAAVWSRGTTRLLAADGLSSSIAYAINEAGDVAGAGRLTPGATDVALLWRGGTRTTLGAGLQYEARGINDLGTVVGWRSALTADNNTAPWVWQNGTLADLPLSTDPVFHTGAALAVNNAGVIAGGARLLPVVWERGVRREISTSSGGAVAINEGGQLVGSIGVGGGNFNAMLWDGTRAVNLHPTSGEYRLSRATGINAGGQVIGKVVPVGPSTLTGPPVIWDAGVMRLLRDLIPPDTGLTLTDATAINDKGQIVVNARLGNRGQAVLLTPVP